MIPSKGAFELIKHFEGYFDDAYLCPARVWTIGYGTIAYPNGVRVKAGDTCTEEEAQEWLTHEMMNKVGKRLNAFMEFHDLRFTQNEYDALISFGYNLGAGKLIDGKSSMSRALISEYRGDIAKAFMLYNKARTGKWPFRRLRVLRGLTRRRQAEKDLFLKL